MGSLLGIVGFGGLLLGGYSLIRPGKPPIGRLPFVSIPTRKMAAGVLGASVISMGIGGAVTPPSDPTPTVVQAFAGLPDTTEASTSTTATTEVTVSTTVPSTSQTTAPAAPSTTSTSSSTTTAPTTTTSTTQPPPTTSTTKSPATTVAPTTTSTTQLPPTTTTAVATGNPGDSKNCTDFATHAEAQKWFDTYFPTYGDVARLDRDGDGIACESLP